MSLIENKKERKIIIIRRKRRKRKKLNESSDLMSKRESIRPNNNHDQLIKLFRSSFSLNIILILLSLMMMMMSSSANCSSSSSFNNQEDRSYYYVTLARSNLKLGGIRVIQSESQTTSSYHHSRPVSLGAAFLGIPYAAAPVGLLRFMPAAAFTGQTSASVNSSESQQSNRQYQLMPGGKISHVQEHNRVGDRCVNLSNWFNVSRVKVDNESENCLKLNVFVPIEGSNDIITIGRNNNNNNNHNNISVNGTDDKLKQVEQTSQGKFIWEFN